MTYWGGATPADHNKCACGVTSPNSCADPSRGCNYETKTHALGAENWQLPRRDLLHQYFQSVSVRSLKPFFFFEQ